MLAHGRRRCFFRGSLKKKKEQTVCAITEHVQISSAYIFYTTAMFFQNTAESTRIKKPNHAVLCQMHNFLPVSKLGFWRCLGIHISCVFLHAWTLPKHEHYVLIVMVRGTMVRQCGVTWYFFPPNINIILRAFTVKTPVAVVVAEITKSHKISSVLT